MLRMPEFAYHQPQSAQEAVAMWQSLEDAMYVAGGTDLYPNLKHKLHAPKNVIGLSSLPTPEVRERTNHFELDGGLSLHTIANHPAILEALAPLSEAASLVAGPQIRRMGTLGGNVLLDTRCLFYNQSEFWRESLGFCLKKDGDWCHVIAGPKTCVAAQSSDTVPVLLALNASIVLLSAAGERELSLRELFNFNGMDHLRIEKGELLTVVRIPKPQAGFRGCYKKLRTRDSIDFPQVGLAVCGVWNADVLEQLEIVVGAVSPKPKPIRGLEGFLGQPLNPDTIAAIGDLVFKQSRPQAAVHGDVRWRRAMTRIFTVRALKELSVNK
jgi:4-hydroxybenzoyl-CoA reductase subunit beta